MSVVALLLIAILVAIMQVAAAPAKYKGNNVVVDSTASDLRSSSALSWDQSSFAIV